MALPHSYTAERFGIIGPYGNIWTPDTFDTAEAAMKHVSDFWKGYRTSLAGYRAVPVVVTVEAIDVPEQSA